MKTFTFTFTFTYTFQDIETAQRVSAAIMGYMVGTYAQPVVETTIKDKSQLVIDYQAHKKHSKAFKRICDAFVPVA